MIYCPVCGTANRDGSRFCNECGGRLDQSIGLLCPNCNASNPLGTLYCNQCGAPLAPPTTGLRAQADKGGYEEAPLAETPLFHPESELAVSPKAPPEWLYQEEETGTEASAPEAAVAEEGAGGFVPGPPELMPEVQAEAQPPSPRSLFSGPKTDRAPISGPLAGIAGVLPLPEEYGSAQWTQDSGTAQRLPKSLVEEIEPKPTASRKSRADGLSPGLIAVVVGVIIFLALVLLRRFIAQGVIHVP